MADIIAEAGLSAGSIYSHFSSKAELLRFVVSDVLKSRFAALIEGVDCDRADFAPAELLARILDGSQIDSAHARVLLQLWAEVSRDAEIAAVAQDNLHNMRAMLAGAVTPWLRVRRDRTSQASTEVADALLAAVFGYVVRIALDAQTPAAEIRRGIIGSFETQQTRKAKGMRLKNKVALITGGTGGMGRAAARMFAQEGATVFVAARHSEPGVALIKEIEAAGGRAYFFQLDTTDRSGWDAAVAEVRDKAGALHVLMNIVGTNDLTVIPYISMEEWNRVFEVNVNGTLMGIQTCAPLMKESGGGSIVNIGSVAGLTGTFSAAYSASKWALEGLSRSAAYALADWGIRCNVIQPGFIETDMTKPMTSNPIMKKQFAHTMDNTILLRRAGKAEEIATTALFLASDESSYITGTDIVVDGGWFSAAPYLGNERSTNMLKLLKTKEKVENFFHRG